MIDLHAWSSVKSTAKLSVLSFHFSLVFLAGQLSGCFAMEVQSSDSNAVVRPEAVTQAEVVPTADLAFKLQGIKEKPSLKVEKVSTNNSQSLLTGELLLEPFVDFKHAVNATLVIHNPAPHAISLRFHSGMTADLVLTTLQGKRLWAWSEDMMFTQAVRDSQFASGERLDVAFAIPPKAFASIPNEGAYLVALFAGEATQSELPTLAPIVLLLTLD